MSELPIDSSDKFEKALEDKKKENLLLKLYIAGNTLKSNQAVQAIREVCEKHLKGRYQLEVIDIYQQPNLAKNDQIIATPTLIKRLPLPLRRIIGDLSKKERILVGLDIQSLDFLGRNRESRFVVLKTFRSTEQFEAAAASAGCTELHLRLFIAGNTQRSQSTILALRKICEDALPIRIHLEVIDIYQEPERARQAQIIATPTLVRENPKPKKVMIGDCSKIENVRTALGLAGI